MAVLTGVTSREMIDNLKVKIKNSENLDNKILPDLIINNLMEIFKNK